MRIDAHHHLWEYDPSCYPWMTDEFAAIRRGFTPEDLQPLLAANGIDRTIVVQTYSSLEETEHFLDLASRAPFIAGVVGWIDLTSDRAAATIAKLQQGRGGGKLVGIRHQVHDEDDPTWLLRPDVQSAIHVVGEAGLAYDLLVRPRELPGAHATAVRHPRVRFVIDHLAKPPIRAGGSPDWDTWMPRLAALPNVYCKLSGLVTEADWRAWSVDAIQPYVARAMAWFGAERMMFGSDWPVCLVAAPYAKVVETARTLIARLAPRHEETIFGKTAVTAYSLAQRTA